MARKGLGRFIVTRVITFVVREKDADAAVKYAKDWLSDDLAETDSWSAEKVNE